MQRGVTALLMAQFLSAFGGHAGVGSGRAVAVQNFYQNVAMLITVGIYTGAAASGAHPSTTLLVLGVSILIATLIVARRLATGTVDIHPR